MPVILPESEWDTWLDADNHDVEALGKLLVPLPADELEAWPVTTLVNKPVNNGPGAHRIAAISFPGCARRRTRVREPRRVRRRDSARRRGARRGGAASRYRRPCAVVPTVVGLGSAPGTSDGSIGGCSQITVDNATDRGAHWSEAEPPPDHERIDWFAAGVPTLGRRARQRGAGSQPLVMDSR